MIPPLASTASSSRSNLDAEYWACILSISPRVCTRYRERHPSAAFAVSRSELSIIEVSSSNRFFRIFSRCATRQACIGSYEASTLLHLDQTRRAISYSRHLSRIASAVTAHDGPKLELGGAWCGPQRRGTGRQE